MPLKFTVPPAQIAPGLTDAATDAGNWFTESTAVVATIDPGHPGAVAVSVYTTASALAAEVILALDEVLLFIVLDPPVHNNV